MPCNMKIDGQKIKFVNNVVYLGVSISSDLWDDTDIARQARYLYCAANKLKTRFLNVQLRWKTFYFVHTACVFMLVNYGATTPHQL